MNTFKPSNTVLVTVKRKTCVFKSVPIWDKVMMSLQGDVSDMFQLNKELSEVKSEINQDMNRKGYALKDVNVTIEFVEEK